MATIVPAPCCSRACCPVRTSRYVACHSRRRCLSSAHSHEHACMLSIASRRQPPSSSAALVTLQARHRTARTGTRHDGHRPRTRKRTCGHPRRGLRVQVRPYRTAGTTRCRDFFDSSQTTWRAPFEERRVGRHELRSCVPTPVFLNTISHGITHATHCRRPAIDVAVGPLF